MNKKYDKYLQFLASEYNILYIGRDSEEIYDDMSGYFLSSSKVDVNVQILDKINTILMKRHINIVVFDVKDNNPLVADFLKAIQSFDGEMMTLLMFEPKEYKKLFDVVPHIDISISYPIDKDIFQKKIFTLLSRSYALNSIGRREIILKQKSVTEDSMDKFFDTYEGSALFLADDLMDVVKNLNDGNLSHQFFVNIANKLDEVASIFAKAERTKSITPIYENIASYLRNIKLEEIKPQNLSAFNYLSEILSDVSVYLMDMFVDRIFKEIHIFKDSLDNNMQFMKSKLEGKSEDEDESELEFFKMIKVFIIDDSALVRNEFKKIFTPIKDIEIIGSVPNPVDAFDVFKRTGLPDVFILDIEMPKMDGLTFLEMIGKQKPIPTIICSTLVARGSSSAIDAMRMGAVDIVLKPTANINEFFGEKREEFVSKVRIAAKSHVAYIQNIKRKSKSKVLDQKQVSSSVKATNSLPPSKKVIAIGASTGGVQILEELLMQLEPNHPPILITQHMPVGFTASFADRLNQILPSSYVKEASEGDALIHGRILIAPGNLHMEVKKSGFQYKATLKNYPKVNSHKPSVNVLFRSMAKEVGMFGVGFLLTGMGDDGATGLLEMKNAEAATYAQDEKSCIVYGMPKKAVDLGAVKQSLSLKEMANIINTVR